MYLSKSLPSGEFPAMFPLPNTHYLYALHRVATSSCRGQVDELATEPFCCCTASMVQAAIDGLVSSWSENIVCLILLTGIRIRIDSVMCPRSSSRGGGGVIQCLYRTDYMEYRTMLNGCTGKCVKTISRPLVGFWTHFKSLHFHFISFHGSYSYSYSYS